MASDARVAERMQSVEDAHEFARRRVPVGLFQMFEAGNGAGITAARNCAAFDEIMFRPRAAVFHHERQLATKLLGYEVSMPVVASPVGLLSVAHTDGEAAVARAVGAAGTITMVSGLTSTPIEDVVRAATGPVFYQLYYFDGRDASAEIIERVTAAGVAGLVLTVDGLPPGGRDIPYGRRRAVPIGMTARELLRFAPQALARPRWLLRNLRAGVRDPHAAMALHRDGTPMGAIEAITSMRAGTPTWEDIPWIRARWNGPLVIKGLLTAEDARRAVGEGADGVVVSNHGGNRLDREVSTITVLPEIVDAVGDQTEVLVDGGVRRGSDIVMALALGAKAVCIGRAYLYPLMAAGGHGVTKVLELLRRQIDQSLACLGVASVHDLDRSFVVRPDVTWAR